MTTNMMQTRVQELNIAGSAGNSDQRLERIPDASNSGSIRNTSLRFIASNSEIEVRLTNDETISALRFEVVFDKKFCYRAPELAVRVQSLNNYINFQDNVVTFVFLDIDGKGIAPGNGPIIKIPRESNQGFDVSAVYATNRSGGISEIGYTISNDQAEDESLVLEQNDPNPFSGRTRLDFSIPSASETKLMIYDVGGALIRTLVDMRMEAGPHSVEWDGCDDSGKPAESGIYLYKLYAGVYSVTRKMVFLSDGTGGK